jgi:predicted phage terminase large subunit-like protein
MSVLSPEELQVAMRSDFYSFMLACFEELNRSADFHPNWHIEVLAAKLQAAREGKRLIINIPPRHLKSLAASVALPAWLLGHDPTAAIINATYGQELSDKFARDCRSILTSPFYQSLFQTRLESRRAALQELITIQGGFRLATSVNGVLTGRGADIIIIDDPLKPSDAMSDSRRNAANEWYDGTLYSRLNDKTKGTIIIIMQRLHENDLVGHVLLKEGWEVVSFPAIAEADEEHIIQTPLGIKKFGRLAGEALHPERESLAVLEGIRATVGTYNFAGQYQQTPAPAGGGMVKEAWFRQYGILPPHFDQIIQSWDTANKPSELSDYSVCATWGVAGSHVYLLNVFRKKIGYPDLKRAVQGHDEDFKPTVILIEDRASGTQLIQDLIDAGHSKVTRYSPDGDKTMRLHAQTATIENGFVHLPTEAHWLDDYLHELTTYPYSRYDDQVDSTSQALSWMKQKTPEPGIIGYYRRLAEEPQGRASALVVRLKAPVGAATNIIGQSGNPYMVQDGYVSVLQEDVAGLLGIGYVRA